MNRKLFLGFNWKNNPADLQVAQSLISNYSTALQNRHSKTQVCVFPPNVYFESFSGLISQKFPEFYLGSQDFSAYPEGSFTGEIGANILKNFGINYALIGHSETRKSKALTNKDIQQKVFNCLSNSIAPVVCIGYQEGYQESKSSLDINFLELKDQLIWALKGLNQSFFELKQKTQEIGEQETTKQIDVDFLIAYEPVWAIGSGKVAKLEDIEKVAQFIWQTLRENLDPHFFEKIKSKIKILYGGSIDDTNCLELSKSNLIDGFLIGSSSLKTQVFKEIIKLL